MGKQSARLYYQGKDHKDIYYNERYHNAMVFNGDVVWRKLRDTEYYVINTQNFNSSAQTWIYYEVILYPAQKVMHVHSLFEMMHFAHNDKMVFGNCSGNNTYPDSLEVIASKDAKLYCKVPLTSYIAGGAVPVRSGFIYNKKADSKSVFIKINDDGTFEENDIGKNVSPRTAYIGGECPDGVIIRLNGGSAILTANKAMSPILDSVEDTICGYGNEIYVLIQVIRENGYQYNAYAWTIKQNHTWRRRDTPITFYYSHKMLNMLYRDGKFIIYLLARMHADDNERLRIYETSDFRSFKEIPVSEKKLSIKYINPSGYSHIDLILDSSAPREEGHYRCENFSISNNAFFRNQKKMDSGGLVFFIRGTEYIGRIYTTVYIDNLYFEQSEGNFAVYGIEDVGNIHEVV